VRILVDEQSRRDCRELHPLGRPADPRVNLRMRGSRRTRVTDLLQCTPHPGTPVSYDVTKGRHAPFGHP